MVRWAHSTNQATSLDTLIYWMINALRTIVINPMRDMYVVCLWCIFAFPVCDRVFVEICGVFVVCKCKKRMVLLVVFFGFNCIYIWVIVSKLRSIFIIS